MASPIEIIGLVETVVALGSKIYKFFENLKDAPQEIRDFCNELELLRKVLLSIGVSTTHTLKTSAFGQQTLGVESIFTCLKLCETEFNTLWLAVSPLRSDRGLKWSQLAEKTKKSVSWVFKADEFEKISRRLDRVKRTLALGMSLSEIEANAEIAERLSSIEAHIEANGALVMVKAEEVKDTIFNLMYQLQHGILHKVEDLSAVAGTQHTEGNLRISRLGEMVASTKPMVEAEFSLSSGLRRDTTTTRDLGFPAIRQSPGLEQGENIGQSPPHRQDVAANINNKDPSYEAMHSLGVMLGSDAVQFLKDESFQSAGPGISDLMNTIQETRKSVGSPLSKRLAQSVSEYSKVFEVFYAGAPEYQSLMWGGMKVVLQAASRGEGHVIAVSEALTEMMDALHMCEREYKLYPELQVRELFEELCKGIVSAAASSIKMLQTSPIRRAMQGMASANQQMLGMKDISIRIKSLSEKVIREVEYLHRRELREAHQRLREVDRKQDETLRMLEEQRRIMTSLEEEQRLLAVVADHQKVVQMLQQLLARQNPA